MSIEKPFSGRIYFLGAGASKAFYPKLPLAGELTLRSLLDSANYLEPPPAINFLARFIRQVNVANVTLDTPIESVLDSLHRHDEPHHYPYENLFVCLVRRLNHGDAVDHTLANWLAAVSDRGDAILTANYDSVLEWNFANSNDILSLRCNYKVVRNKLAACEQRLGEYPNAPKRFLVLLKLHGSVSWSFCSACGHYDLHETHLYGAEEAITGVGACRNCGKKGFREPVFVLPALQKDYSESCVAEIWSNAELLLREAREIIFAGFSLNPNDQRIRALLSKCHKVAKTQHVRIIDPFVTTIINRYKKIYSDAVDAPSQMDWRQYLTSLRSDRVLASSVRHFASEDRST